VTQGDHPQTPASGGERGADDAANAVRRMKANWYQAKKGEDMSEERANTSRQVKTALEKLLKELDSEFTEEVLKALLTGMGLVFLLSSKYRKNIENFNGRYLFQGKNNAFSVAAVFQNGSMNVVDGTIDSPNITIIFKNPAALRNFIFSPKPDILNAILQQDVSIDGNLNYLYKFAYMANHLKLMAQELIA
jgi:hypothetical protein